MINVHSNLIREDLRLIGVDAFAVLMVITTHINAKKQAWPGIERIRNMTGLSKERTYKAISRLIELEHIERKQQNVKGEWGKVVYRLTTQYLGVYMGVSEFPMEATEESEPLAVFPEYGYPESGFPESISIDHKQSIEHNKVLNKESAREKFTPPTPIEIEMHFAEKLAELPGINGPDFWAAWEAQKFEEYYTSANWKVGRAKMKDWRRAVSNWIRRGMEGRTYLKPCPSSPDYTTNQHNGYGKEEWSIGPNKADRELASLIARIADGS